MSEVENGGATDEGRQAAPKDLDKPEPNPYGEEGVVGRWLLEVKASGQDPKFLAFSHKALNLELQGELSKDPSFYAREVLNGALAVLSIDEYRSSSDPSYAQAARELTEIIDGKLTAHHQLENVLQGSDSEEINKKTTIGLETAIREQRERLILRDQEAPPESSASSKSPEGTKDLDIPSPDRFSQEGELSQWLTGAVASEEDPRFLALSDRALEEKLGKKLWVGNAGNQGMQRHISLGALRVQEYMHRAVPGYLSAKAELDRMIQDEETEENIDLSLPMIHGNEDRERHAVERNELAAKLLTARDAVITRDAAVAQSEEGL